MRPESPSTLLGSGFYRHRGAAMARSAHGDDADGQPPRDTRFKKGHSGNPSGRPKKVASFKADLAAELQQTLVLVENGKQQRVSKQRAFVKTLVSARCGDGPLRPSGWSVRRRAGRLATTHACNV